jgi:uncharacterized membrane protein YfcA
LESIFLLLLGAASGLIAGLSGLGGGTVIVPALTWLFGKAALHDAIVISWFCVFFNSVGATVSQYRMRSLEERERFVHASRFFLLGVAIAAPVVALTLSSGKAALSPSLVGIVQLSLAAALLWPRMEAAQARTLPRVVDAGVGAMIGGASALIGIGGGAYTTAYMVYGPRRPLRDAIAAGNVTGVAVGALSVLGFGLSWALGQQAVNATAHAIPPSGMVLLIAAGTLFSALGVRLSRRMSSLALKRFLVGFLALSALHLLLG